MDTHIPTLSLHYTLTYIMYTHKAVDVFAM